MLKTIGTFAAVAAMCFSPALVAKDIIHDAEYNILKAQNAERWQADDKVIDKKLADIRKKNGGKPPNVLMILLDDVGFGEIGSPDLAVIRGYQTPNISKLASQGMSLQRMYTEPSCTPTRVAFLTGRHPVRTGLVDAKATLAGEGLAEEEVTIAEVLKESGYNTSHVGKWHQGDIQEAYAQNQGFMHAEFPIHQQGQLALMHGDAENAGVIAGTMPGQVASHTLDNLFVPNPGHMVTGVELRNGKLYEVDLKAGEPWTQAKYRAMNERYQKNVMSQLGKLANQDKPFFLNYWPLFPLSFTTNEIDEFKTLNGGPIAESIVEVDSWIGNLLAEVDKLGIADNTIVIVMGDNGPFMQYARNSGQSDRIYRGGKGDHLEGGVRTNAFVRWPDGIEAGSSALDIVHVSDLFTTLARIAQGSEEIPRDRIIDGVDQSGVLLLGDTHGRRDYVYIYEGPALKSVVKNKYKMHLAPPGENPILFSQFFDLYRDSRESRPESSILYGPWAGGPFGGMIKRHMKYRNKYPDRKLPHDTPYEGIENLRPETQTLLDNFIAASKM